MRTKRGRPKNTPERQQVIGVYVPTDLLLAIDAERKGTPRSVWIKNAIKTALNSVGAMMV